MFENILPTQADTLRHEANVEVLDVREAHEVHFIKCRASVGYCCVRFIFTRIVRLFSNGWRLIHYCDSDSFRKTKNGVSVVKKYIHAP